MSDMAEVRGDLVRLTGQVDTVEFHGDLLAMVSTEGARSPRWTVMQLYRITDGPSTGRYVLGITGCTVVYHVHDSVCNTGVATVPSELPADAEPCTRCEPPPLNELTDGAGAVDLEEEWRNVQVCDDADAVIDVLLATNRGKKALGRTGVLSRPAENLVQRAARKDPAFNPTQIVERL